MGKHSRSFQSKGLIISEQILSLALAGLFYFQHIGLISITIMHVLGRFDRVDLPGLNLANIHAKVDTGAFTSSLHCHHAQVVDGKLEFVLLDEEHPEFTGMKFVLDTFEERNIKNSFGEIERRFVITTLLKIFNEEIITEFSLSNRGSLKFPILIGRKILRDRFLIDVTKINLSFKEKQRKIRKSRKKSH